MSRNWSRKELRARAALDKNRRRIEQAGSQGTPSGRPDDYRTKTKRKPNA